LTVRSWDLQSLGAAARHSGFEESHARPTDFAKAQPLRRGKVAMKGTGSPPPESAAPQSRHPRTRVSGAPRPMKMGTIVSPWHYYEPRELAQCHPNLFATSPGHYAKTVDHAAAR
jgi:hypothetical protein